MNIYIGNLNYRVRESDLQQVLEEYGTVESVKLIIDRDTRRSKGKRSKKRYRRIEWRRIRRTPDGCKRSNTETLIKIASKYTNGDMDKILYPRSSFIPF